MLCAGCRGGRWTGKAKQLTAVVMSSLALVTASSSVFRCSRVFTAWVATSRHSGLDTSWDTRVTRGSTLGRNTAAWAGCSTSCSATAHVSDC